MSIATGSLTITDLYDARQIQVFISSNLRKFQTYNPDNGSYNPDWSSTNLVLEAEVYIAGSSSEISSGADINYIKWYLNNSSTPISSGGGYTISGTNNRVLRITQNVMGNLNSITIKCEVSYQDPTTNLDVISMSDIDFTKVASGGGLVAARAEAPNGNIFKNNLIASLTAQCTLWRGIEEDTTSVSYQWYKRDATVTTDEGGGLGWKKLSSTTVSGQYSGATTSTLTIYPGAVDGVQAFKCVIKDTDSTSPSYNQEFTDTITFYDQQDPYYVTIRSTGGEIFKDGVGSSQLTALLYQGGTEVDSNGTEHTYKWYMYNNSAALVPNWRTDGYLLGKTITVDQDDVNIKSTFVVVVDE